MGVTTGPYEESVALEPWDYGGPEHLNRTPHVVIVDRDGLLVDVEEGLAEQFEPGRPWPARAAGDPPPPLTSVDVTANSQLRALFVYPPSAPGERIVRLRTLGCMEIEGDESCGRWLGQRPGGLLKFLVCRRYRVVHAQDIAEALWGHGGFVSSGTVRQCVHDLRAKLDGGRSDTSGQLVITRQCGYALAPSAIVDADDFAVHVRRGVTARRRDQREIATVHLRRALSMYRGGFLSDEPEAEWARAERDRLREHMEDALEALAELYLDADDAATATACLRRRAEMRPFDDDAHRQLLAVLLRQGRHSHAWRCYQAFGARLWREFGRTPGFTLAELDAELGEPARAAAPSRAAHSPT